MRGNMSFPHSERDGLPENSECIICYNLCEKPINKPTNISRKIYKSCCKHLNSNITKESAARLTLDSDLNNRKQLHLPFCQNCFDTALELMQLSEQLESFQRDLNDLAFKFSLKILHRRRAVNISSTNPSVEVDVSDFPSDLFSIVSASRSNTNVNTPTDENESEEHENIFVPHVEVTEEDGNVFNTEDIQIKNEPQELHVSYEEYEETSNQEDTYLTNGNSFTVLPYQNQYSSVPNLHNSHHFENDTPRETATMESSGFNEGYSHLNAEFVNPVPSTLFRKMSSLTPKVMSHNDSEDSHGVTVTPVNIPNTGEYLIDNNNPTTAGGSPRKTFYPPSMSFTKLPQQNSILRSHLQDPSSSYTASSVNVDAVKSNILRRRRMVIPVPNTPDVSQSCISCKLVFPDYRSLMIHMRDNRHYKCEFCEKSSTTMSDFRRHRRIHTGERPYQCPVCSRAFNDKSTMLRHSRGHSGEKPFTCAVCNKSFRRKENLKTHIQLHYK